MTPNSTYTLNGITIKEKIIPDDMVWTDAKKASAAGFSKGDKYKSGKLLCGTGKPKYITIHNTEDLNNILDDAQQYVLATYNQNMGSCRPNFYIDETSCWQILRAGTGLCENDPDNQAEVNWTCGDGSRAGGGNASSIALEVVMNENSQNNALTKERVAKLVAWLLVK